MSECGYETDKIHTIEAEIKDIPAFGKYILDLKKKIFRPSCGKRFYETIFSRDITGSVKNLVYAGIHRYLSDMYTH